MRSSRRSRLRHSRDSPQRHHHIFCRSARSKALMEALTSHAQGAPSSRCCSHGRARGHRRRHRASDPPHSQTRSFEVIGIVRTGSSSSHSEVRACITADAMCTSRPHGKAARKVLSRRQKRCGHSRNNERAWHERGTSSPKVVGLERECKPECGAGGLAPNRDANQMGCKLSARASTTDVGSNAIRHTAATQ